MYIFLVYTLKAKIRIRDRLQKENDEITALNRKILCGKYAQKNGEDYLKLDDRRKISVTNSSSGQQETLPLASTNFWNLRNDRFR